MESWLGGHVVGKKYVVGEHGVLKSRSYSG